MSKNVPLYYLLLTAFFFLGLGILVSPHINPLPKTVPPGILPVGDNTVSVTVAPGGRALQCNWCGAECVELGSRSYCPDMPVDSSTWCGPQEVDGQTTCQATVKPDRTVCDANNACDTDESCYSYSELGSARCVGHEDDPCQFCSSGKCSISAATIYPPQVICE